MFRERMAEWANLIGFLASMVSMMVVHSTRNAPRSTARLSVGNAVVARRMSVNAQREVDMAYVRLASLNR